MNIEQNTGQGTNTGDIVRRLTAMFQWLAIISSFTYDPGGGEVCYPPRPVGKLRLFPENLAKDQTMFVYRALLASILSLALACAEQEPPSAGAASPESTPPTEDVTAGEPASTETAGAESGELSEGGEEVIAPETLQLAGSIELTQYTVAYIGSGTMGGGTLTLEGKTYPFKIAGLGFGGMGVSALDATGTVYNLPDLDAFQGTYGTARLGMTAGESGGGKLWLRNPDGVVIELESEMRGLALAGGVDGILIQWEEEQKSAAGEFREDSERVVGDAIESGADAVEDGVDAVKGWFKQDE